MITVFFSYSHKDEQLRDELEVHLSMLKREGRISTWHDRRVSAGSEIDVTIDTNLRTADVVLLLVSPQFLASDYCYQREMEFALDRHEKGDAVVIPVILRSCDWKHAPFGKLLATPTDGHPVTLHKNTDQAFSIVVQDIRRAIDRIASKTPDQQQHEPASSTSVAMPQMPRSSNLRVKACFTDADKDRFLSDSFDYIAQFFRSSLQELNTRNPDVQTNYFQGGDPSFSARVYRKGQVVSQCCIRVQNGGLGGSGLAYSTDFDPRGNSYNELMTIESGDQSLHLKPIGMAMHINRDSDQLTQNGAAEYFWAILMSPLQ